MIPMRGYAIASPNKELICTHEMSIKATDDDKEPSSSSSKFLELANVSIDQIQYLQRRNNKKSIEKEFLGKVHENLLLRAYGFLACSGVMIVLVVDCLGLDSNESTLMREVENVLKVINDSYAKCNVNPFFGGGGMSEGDDDEEKKMWDRFHERVRTRLQL